MQGLPALSLTLLGLVFSSFFALPIQAQDLGDQVSEPGLFSYQAPKGWKILDSPTSKYKVCMDAPKNDFAANINVVRENYSDSLEKYVELNKTAIKGSPMFTNVEVLDEKPFETTSGLKGVRLALKDTLGKLNLQQTFYFFDGGSFKLVVTASSLIADGDHYAPIFDASLKTFSLK